MSFDPTTSEKKKMQKSSEKKQVSFEEIEVTPAASKISDLSQIITPEDQAAKNIENINISKFEPEKIDTSNEEFDLDFS